MEFRSRGLFCASRKNKKAMVSHIYEPIVLSEFSISHSLDQLTKSESKYKQYYPKEPTQIRNQRTLNENIEQNARSTIH